MNRIIPVVGTIALLSLSIAPAFAQFGPTVDVGIRLGTDIAGDVEEEFLGVDARISLPTLPVVLNPAFDYYFTPSGTDFYQFSANALLSVNMAALPTIAPYVGGGLGIARSSADVSSPGANGTFSDTDIGINLIGGGAVSVGSLKPFAQLQLTLGNPDLVTVAIGVHVKVSG